MADELVSDGAYRASAEQAVGPYLRAVRRNWRLVAAVTLVATIVAGFTVSRISSSYDASASILVSPLPNTTDSNTIGLKTVIDTGDPARTIQTAAALIDTPEAAQGAAQMLGKHWTAGEVMQAVTVVPRGASDVLAVTAKEGSGSAAAQVANAFATSALAYRASVVQTQIRNILASLEARLATLRASGGAGSEVQALAATIAQLRVLQGPGREPTMSISQTAQPSGSPSGAPHWLIVLLALAGGFVLGSVAALGLETFRRPIRDREELITLYPLPVLAAIPRLKRGRRRRDIPPWGFSPVAFEQMRLLRVQLSADIVSPVIMVTSAGSGDGKTTVAAALAAAFAEVEEKVILMDLDLRKPDLTKVLEMDGTEPSVPRGVPIDVPRLPGVKVVRAPLGDIAQFEALIRRLPDLLAQARMSADCVIIDTAPVGEVSDGLRIAPICDDVVFVARPRHTDRRRLTLARDLLERAVAPMAGLVVVGEDSQAIGGDYSYEYAHTPGEPIPVEPQIRIGEPNGPVQEPAPPGARGSSGRIGQGSSSEPVRRTAQSSPGEQ